MRQKTPFLFFIALLFRLPGLNRPLIMDEGFAIKYIAISLKALVNKLVTDSQPPFYYCCLKLWALVSGDPVFLRLFTVLLGSLICVILFKIVERLYTKEAAYYAFIFASISPQLIFQSQHLRPYCMGTFLPVLLVYAFIKFISAQETARPLYYFAMLSIVTVLCLYSYYMAIFVIAALNIFAIYFLKKNKEKLFLWLGSQITAAFLYSFWFPYFLAQKYLIEKGITCHLLEMVNAKLGFYIGKIHAGNILRIILAYFQFDDIMGSAVRYSSHIKHKIFFISIIAVLIIPVSFCILRAIKMMVKTEKIKGISALFLLLIFIPAISIMICSIGGDLNLWGPAVVNIRYLSQSSIYAIIIITLFLASLKRGLAKRVLLSCIVILFLTMDVNLYRYPGDIYRGAIDYLSDRSRNCTTVVLGPPNALCFFNPLADKRFSNYRILEYDGSSRNTAKIKSDIAGLDHLYFYYFKSAENMILFPDLDTKFENMLDSIGFLKKSQRKVNDILIISYFEKKT